MKFLLERAAAGVFFKPGFRKTSITLAAIKVLKDKGLINKVLVVAPKEVVYNTWPNEIKKWADFNHLTYTILHGPKKDKALEEDVDLYLINFEGLEWLIKPERVPGRKRPTFKSNPKKFKKYGFDLLVVDELSRFKDFSTNRFKMMRDILCTFKRRYGLTGSPTPNNYLSLFGECFILDEGASLGRYVTQYRNKYFDSDYMGYTYTLKDGADKEILSKIDHMVITGDENLLKLPETVYNNLYADLPPTVEKFYNTLAEKLRADWQGGKVKASNAAVKVGKLMQVASGNIYVEPEVVPLLKLPDRHKKWVMLHKEKLKVLSNLIDELQGAPLLIGYNFKHELEEFKKHFGKTIPYIGSGVSPAKSKKIQEKWNNGDIPFLFGHPASMGHGLNLQGCCNQICWYTQPWSYELFEQFIGRVRRSGNQHQTVMVHRIIAKGTIDENLTTTLENRKDMQQALFDFFNRKKKK